MGRVLRWITAGESHGRALVAVIEGMVAGVGVTSEDIAGELKRRRLGYGRGARMKFEADEVTVLAGSDTASRWGTDRHRDRQHRVAEVETVMSADPVTPPSWTWHATRR
jgi:chorismate synthase